MLFLACAFGVRDKTYGFPPGFVYLQRWFLQVLLLYIAARVLRIDLFYLNYLNLAVDLDLIFFCESGSNTQEYCLY